MSGTQLFFGTPIYHQSLDTDVTTSLEELELKGVYNDDYHQDNDMQFSTFNECTNILHREEGFNLANLFIGYAQSYVKSINEDIDVSQMRIVDSWFNKYAKDGFVGWHDHGYIPNTISMVYYMNIHDGDLHFKSPNPFDIGFPSFLTSPMTDSEIIIKPKPGDLVMFPSWLKHKSTRNTKGLKRKIFSANLHF